MTSTPWEGALALLRSEQDCTLLPGTLCVNIRRHSQRAVTQSTFGNESHRHSCRCSFSAFDLQSVVTFPLIPATAMKVQ